MKRLSKFKYFIRWTGILMIALLLGACATSAKYQARLDAWHGQSIDAFTKMWGYPDKILKLENHQTAYIYNDRELVSTPVTQMPNNITTVQSGRRTTVISTPGTIVGGQTRSLSCTTWIVFNSKTKKIIHTRFRGNNCVAY